MKNILNFLKGKKGVIASIIMSVVAYLASKSILGDAEVLLLGSITTILFGVASYETSKLYKK